MPLVRIELRRGKSVEYRQAVADGIYEAMRETIQVPEHDRRGRTTEAKQALYRRIAERLREAPGIRPEDVFVTLLENGLDDWSFGNGLAQYVKAQ